MLAKYTTMRLNHLRQPSPSTPLQKKVKLHHDYTHHVSARPAAGEKRPVQCRRVLPARLRARRTVQPRRLPVIPPGSLEGQRLRRRQDAARCSPLPGKPAPLIDAAVIPLRRQPGAPAKDPRSHDKWRRCTTCPRHHRGTSLGQMVRGVL